MAKAETVKQERMHIRLDTLSKQRLERAAAYVHKSLSEFVLGQALYAADKVIQKHETLMLDEGDWGVFLDALENPPAQRQAQAGIRRTQETRQTVRGCPRGHHHPTARQKARAGILRLRRTLPQPIPAALRQPGHSASGQPSIRRLPSEFTTAGDCLLQPQRRQPLSL